jgi:hypothetical protein
LYSLVENRQTGSASRKFPSSAKHFGPVSKQCCQIFWVPKTGKKYTKTGENILKGHKIFQMALKLIKWPLNIPTSSVARPSKIYPNCDFWFENKYHLATLIARAKEGAQ